MRSSTKLIALLSAWGCAGEPQGGNEEHEGHSRGNTEGRAHDAHEVKEDHHDHGGHAHGEGGTSDLDRPVEELFAAACEHGVEAHACDECRYEVGVVKAPQALFDDGLLEKVRPEARSAAAPLRLTGEVQYDDRRVAHVSPQVDGVIRKVHVTLGDRVAKGALLVEISSVEIGQAKAAYREALALERLARKSDERIEALRGEGITSEKEAIQARQELTAAEIRTGAAKGTLERLGVRGGAGARAGRLVLRAPSAGTILDMHAVTGEVARANESLLTIGDNSAVWVWADLYERDFARVLTQQERAPLAARIFVKAFPGQPFPGTVDFISPSMSPASRTIKVRVTAPNPEGRLLAGMFADVEILTAGGESTLSLPADAVLEDAGRAFVFVHREGDYFVRRPVVPGGEHQEWVAIREGLRGEETVVANGAFLLKSDVLRSKMGAGCAD